MQPVLHFAVPGDPGQRTGGYLYDRRLARELAGLGWDVRPLPLDASFPQPAAAALAAAAASLRALSDGACVLIDGLAFGAMPEVVWAERQRLRLVALVHHPLGYEAGLAPAHAVALIASEQRALAAARAVLVTSPTTGRTLAEAFQVPAAAITVARPGIDPAPSAHGSGGRTVALLAVGSVIPRKAFGQLVRALAPLRGLRWQLTIVGSLERSREAVSELQAAIAEADLCQRVVLTGELDEAGVARSYQAADLFVSAAGYEGFGMALAGALAHGLPIVAVAGGAVGDWLDPTAAILVAPGDPAALTEALRQAIGDPDRRAALCAGAERARERLPSWADTAAAADGLLRRLVA